MATQNRSRIRPRVLHQEPDAVTWARKKAGLTKRALAGRVGISEQLMGEIESGWRSATPANLLKIADALNCPLVALERKTHPQPLGADDAADEVQIPGARYVSGPAFPLPSATPPRPLEDPVHTTPPRDSQLAPVSFPDFESAYVALLRLATCGHQFRIAPRGNAAREVIGVGFRLTDPRQRLPYLAARQVNPVFHFAEALWYLAGRRDLEMIGHYAPSISSSSRDGVTIDGSAYGHRIFSPEAVDGRSPFDRVMALLRRETDSKRGFIPVFTPDELAVEDNPDVACLAGLHFLPRDGRLHMVCSMRANDLDRGLLSDVFSFTMIQEYAAVQLGLDLGTYTHYMGSAHVNDVNAIRVARVLEEAATRAEAAYFVFPLMPVTTTRETITRVLEHEAALRTNAVRYSADDIARLDLEDYWQQAVLLFEVHRQITHDQVEAVSPDVLGALDPGLRWLLRHRWPACNPPVSSQ